MFFWILVAIVLIVTVGVGFFMGFVDEDAVSGFLAGFVTLMISTLLGILIFVIGTTLFTAPYEKVGTTSKPITSVTEDSYLVQDSHHVVYREEEGMTTNLVFVPLDSAEVKTTDADPEVKITEWEATNPWHSTFSWGTTYTYEIFIPEASQ